MACLRTNAQCQASCQALAGNGLGSPGMIWAEAVCMAGAGGAGSGGSGAAGASGSAGAGGAGARGGASGAGGRGGAGQSSGGCMIAPGQGADLAALAVAAALIALALRVDGRKRTRGD